MLLYHLPYALSNFLNDSELIEEFSYIIFPLKDLIFSPLATICCKYKCIKYNKRCICPPFSLHVKKELLSKTLCIIIFKTYGYTNLTHFKEYPEDLNSYYLFKKRIFVRRWTQQDFYSKVYQIFKDRGLLSDEIYLAGFSKTKKCSDCIDKNILKNPNYCKAFPSPEALGIDLYKSIKKYHYPLRFGVKKYITKIALIATNDLSLKTLSRNIFHGNKNFGKDLVDKNIKLTDYASDINILENYSDLNFRYVEKEEIQPFLREDFSNLIFWNDIILWNIDDSNTRKTISINKLLRIKENLHKDFFMANNYFSLDFLTTEVFKKDTNFYKNYQGIEFIR